MGHLNIKTKMLDIEARVLIGWYSLASQSERVPTRCFYVKVAYLSYGEYIYRELSNLNPNKSTSHDNISGQLLKNCARSLALPLQLLFNLSFKTGSISSE